MRATPLVVLFICCARATLFPSNLTFPYDLKGPTSIVIDYGTVVSGLVSFSLQVLSSETQILTLVSTYTETAAYVGGGDWTAVPILARSSADDRLITQTFSSNSEGWTESQIQGSFRFQGLQLSSSATVRIHSIDIVPDHYNGEGPVGNFECDIPELNEVRLM